MQKSNIIQNSIISLFVTLYAVVATVSTIHLIDFFLLSNPYWLAVTLAVAFELGAAASLASIIILDKTNKNLVWFLFIIITAMQIQGNMFYTYTNLEDFQTWSQLFSLNEDSIIYQKRILSIVSGGILPVVALGFIKSLVDYISPKKEDENVNKQENNEIDNPMEIDEEKADSEVPLDQPIQNFIENEEELNEDNISQPQQADASEIMGLEEEDKEDKMEKAMREKAENEKKELADNS